MRIYLDCCCLNRPFDDMHVERNRLEAEAVSTIMSKVEAGSLELVASEILVTEVSRASDGLRRRSCMESISKAIELVRLNDEVRSEARRLAACGFKAMDAAHIASAKAGRSDIFLTVDERLLRIARRLGEDVPVRVESPVTWLME